MNDQEINAKNSYSEDVTELLKKHYGDLRIETIGNSSVEDEAQLQKYSKDLRDIFDKPDEILKNDPIFRLKRYYESIVWSLSLSLGNHSSSDEDYLHEYLEKELDQVLISFENKLKNKIKHVAEDRRKIEMKN